MFAGPTQNVGLKTTADAIAARVKYGSGLDRSATVSSGDGCTCEVANVLAAKLIQSGVEGRAR